MSYSNPDSEEILPDEVRYLTPVLRPGGIHE